MQIQESRLTRQTVGKVAQQIYATWAQAKDVEIDLSQVAEIDSSGVGLLSSLKRRATQEDRKFRTVGLKPAVMATLKLFPAVQLDAGLVRKPGLFERLGEQTAAIYLVVIEYLVLCSDVMFLGFSGLFSRRQMHWSKVAYEMAAIGSRALGVVGLIAFLIGGTIALQSAIQLRNFGANIFVVDLIGVSLTRELGPLMVAIVVAGRSGSAIAAELGTMVITEEVAAIKTMGINPIRFLVVPKVVAMTVSQPILTILADAIGILGGMVVGAFYLEVGPLTFLNRLQQALFVRDILIGVIKSILFAQLIVTVSALCGLRTRGGADAVGRATTMSVVASIFAVIVADAVCSFVFYLGD